MSAIVKIDGLSAYPDLDTLEDILKELSRFGEPSINKLPTNGWVCYVDMFIQGKGITFKVRSEFDHATPFGAGTQCVDRMRKALKDIKEKK